MAGLAEWISENVLGVESAPGGADPFQYQTDPFTGQALAPQAATSRGTGWTPTYGQQRGATGRGRTLTEVYTVFPDGTKQLKSVTPGGVKLYSRDVTAAKRTRKIGRLVNRLFPTRRRKTRKR